MRSGRLPIRFLILLALVLVLPSVASAQGNAQLVGYAILPAGTVTDGGPAGQALANAGIVNGLSMPFASQPLGSVTGVVPGDYAGTWLVLTNGTFQNPNQSGDFLIRIYTVQTDLRSANGGSGSANPVDWLVLTDPRKLLGNLALNSRARNLTGADITPRAFVRLPDGSFWVADAKGNQLLHFDQQGKLLDAPTAVGSGIAGLSMTPDGSQLIVALNNGQIQSADPNSGAVTGARGNYGAEGGATIGGISMISASEALVIEIDGKDGASGVKRVYLANLDAGNKVLLADLLNIDDPNGLSGLGTTFTFPYAAINGIARINDNTILVVNNNRVPFGEGRQQGNADSTEFIQVQVGVSLNR